MPGFGGDQSVTLSVTDVNGDAGQCRNFVAGSLRRSVARSADGTYLYHGECQRRSAAGSATVATDTFNFTVTDSLGRSQSTTLTLNVMGRTTLP